MIFLILSSLLTGMFKDILIYLYLIITHEFGHLLMGKYFGWKTNGIYIYPYGGCTKFNIDINKSIKEEFIVLIFGPIFQSIFTFILIMFLKNDKYINMVISYSISLLIFNLLPIYPLDGGKLLNLFFNKVISYKKSFLLSIFSSMIIIFLIIVFSIKYNLNLNFILVFIFIFTKIIEEYKKRKYYYNKFLLERYINKYNFKKLKKINNINDMMKEKRHIFKYNGQYITEKEFLKKIYKKY